MAGPTGLAVRRIKVEFKPPSRDYEGSFSRETKISDVVVATSGGTIPGDQVLFVEVAPVLDGVRGLASEYLMAVVPSGGIRTRSRSPASSRPKPINTSSSSGTFPARPTNRP